MDLKIIETKRSDIFKRADIKAEFDEKTIPSKSELRERLSAQLNKPVEQIVIRKVDTRFGAKKGIAVVRVYDSQEIMKKNESKYVQVRNLGKEEVKAETAAAVEKK